MGTRIKSLLKMGGIVVVSVGMLAAMVANAQAAGCLDPPGDINGNGEVNVGDAQCTALIGIWSFLGGQGSAPSCAAGDPLTADLDCNEKIGVPDVQLNILQALAIALPSSFDADGNNCVDACEEVPEPPSSVTVVPLWTTGESKGGGFVVRARGQGATAVGSSSGGGFNVTPKVFGDSL